MTRGFLRIIAKVVAAIVLTHAAVFYLRLGWFIPLVWLVGTLVVLLVGRSDRAAARRAIVSGVVTGSLYLIGTIGSWRLLTDRKHSETFPMSWIDKGTDNQFKESEVVLEFVDYPGNLVGLYSNEVSQYLRRTAVGQVDVTFEITSDFGCMRGYHETRIGDLTKWKSAWGYAGAQGNASELPSPWAQKSGWWCP